MNELLILLILAAGLTLVLSGVAAFSPPLAAIVAGLTLCSVAVSLYLQSRREGNR